jgi:hypothetical protein
MKIKKVISISMLIIIMITSALITFANDPLVITLQIDNTLATVNGQSTQLATAPYIDKYSGRTLVPLRFVAEEMGYDVEWDSHDKIVKLSKIIKETDTTITKNIIRVQINNNTAEQYATLINKNDENDFEIIVSGEKGFVSRVPDESKGILQGSIKLEQPPVIKDGYTMVPIRFIAEEMDYYVDWNGKNKTITISEYNVMGMVPIKGITVKDGVIVEE